MKIKISPIIVKRPYTLGFGLWTFLILAGVSNFVTPRKISFADSLDKFSCEDLHTDLMLQKLPTFV
ncbi:MAG: hypothetical protein ABI954_07135 [Pyrinomonadaceae bacterium]